MIKIKEFSGDSVLDSSVKTIGMGTGLILSDGLAAMPGKQNRTMTRLGLALVGLAAATFIDDSTPLGDGLSSFGAGMAGGQVVGAIRDSWKKEPPKVKDPAKPELAEKFLRGMAGIETVDPSRDEEEKNDDAGLQVADMDSWDDGAYWNQYEDQAVVQSSNSAA